MNANKRRPSARAVHSPYYIMVMKQLKFLHVYTSIHERLEKTSTLVATAEVWYRANNCRRRRHQNIFSCMVCGPYCKDEGWNKKADNDTAEYVSHDVILVFSAIQFPHCYSWGSHHAYCLTHFKKILSGRCNELYLKELLRRQGLCLCEHNPRTLNQRITRTVAEKHTPSNWNEYTYRNLTPVESPELCARGTGEWRTELHDDEVIQKWDCTNS